MFEQFGKINFTPCTKVDEFVKYLKDGHLMGSKCLKCGLVSFPPRADCADCRSDAFEFTELSGLGTLYTYTKIHTAPTGFEDEVPYVLGVIDLKETGRLLARFSESTSDDDIKIGMALKVIPVVDDQGESERIYYKLERA